ncbi:hypothetical protein JTE90_014263 [Oedothorax gibbosus]|uniref:Uncharacterized protein n=1 Tax=Oedothorax gibbosus TaxID=931172 RepID=A0AAV6UJW5_9ARAC|nr:hypothetical protein JTE90_014263 [Oedothorax gibbosus]
MSYTKQTLLKRYNPKDNVQARKPTSTLMRHPIQNPLHYNKAPSTDSHNLTDPINKITRFSQIHGRIIPAHLCIRDDNYPQDVRIHPHCTLGYSSNYSQTLRNSSPKISAALEMG